MGCTIIIYIPETRVIRQNITLSDDILNFQMDIIFFAWKFDQKTIFHRFSYQAPARPEKGRERKNKA